MSEVESESRPVELFRLFSFHVFICQMPYCEYLTDNVRVDKFILAGNLPCVKLKFTGLFFGRIMLTSVTLNQSDSNMETNNESNTW